MKRSLENEVALITGGNSGIGKAISVRFAAAGASIAIFGTNEKTGKETIEEILKEFPSANVRFFSVNVADTNAVEVAIQEVISVFGKLDILVNNAGVTADQLLMKMTEEDWDRVLDINLKSCFNTCRAAIRAMLRARKGKIINISSVVGLIGNPGQVNYAASKAGMIGLTKALAKEVASRQITVNCVAPGFIKTKMTNALSEKQQEEAISQIPMKRMGDPDEIASFVEFLASHAGSYITGQTIAIDGGMAM